MQVKNDDDENLTNEVKEEIPIKATLSTSTTSSTISSNSQTKIQKEEKTSTYSCSSCSFTCDNIGLLKLHESSQHSKNNNIFKCPQCTFSTNRYVC